MCLHIFLCDEAKKKKHDHYIILYKYIEWTREKEIKRLMNNFVTNFVAIV